MIFWDFNLNLIVKSVYLTAFLQVIKMILWEISCKLCDDSYETDTNLK